MEHSYRETLLFLISTPLYVVFIGLEMIFSSLHSQGWYSGRGLAQNAYLMLVNLVIDFGMRTVAFVALTAIFNRSFQLAMPPLLYWVLLFLLQDLTFYTLHYLDHKVRLFWAVHITHHSSSEFNLTVGLRSSVFEPLYRFIYFIPMAVLGFKPLDIFFVFSLTQLYGVFIHTQAIKNLGILEWLMATPSHHRVHHGRNPKYIDKNMGMFLIVWDRPFGTFEPESEPVQYGVTKPPTGNHPLHTLTHEFENIIADVRQAPNFRAKMMYIFGPPGWKHE